MRKITVAQALKERKRLETKLKQYEALICEQNCIVEGGSRHIDVNALMEKCEALEERILKVRAAVAAVNLKITSKLIKMEMLKKKRMFVSQLPTDEFRSDCRRVARQDEDVPVRQDVVLTARIVFDLTEKLDEQINTIQDELDQFNATATVVLED